MMYLLKFVPPKSPQAVFKYPNLWGPFLIQISTESSILEPMEYCLEISYEIRYVTYLSVKLYS